MDKKTAVLIPGRTDLHRGIYSLARKLKSDYITVNFNRLRNLVQKDLVKKVIIIIGSNDHGALTAYDSLKKLNKNVKYILVDSWPWTVKKPDHMVLLPGTSTKKLIKQILKG
jgi:hypothetical protein